MSHRPIDSSRSSQSLQVVLSVMRDQKIAPPKIIDDHACGRTAMTVDNQVQFHATLLICPSLSTLSDFEKHANEKISSPLRTRAHLHNGPSAQELINTSYKSSSAQGPISLGAHQHKSSPTHKLFCTSTHPCIS